MRLGSVLSRLRRPAPLLTGVLVTSLALTMNPFVPTAAAETTAAEPELVVVAASAAGDAWDSTDGGAGGAVLTYGHIGCTGVDAAGLCTGGVWGKVPGAQWIWRSQMADMTKTQAAFTKTFVVAANQAAQPAVLNIAADNVFSVVLNGTEVASGSTFTQGTNFSVPLKAGTNSMTISVSNILNGQTPYNNPAGLAWAIRAVAPVDDPPPTTPYQPPVADAGADQVVPEGSTVRLDGSGSHASTAPSLQASQQHGALPGGTSLGASLSGLDPDAAGLRVRGSVDVGQGPAVQNTSIAYVIDVSGSTGGGGGCGGDVNGDRSSNTVLDCEIAAALKLQEEVAAAGTVDKVAVIRFDTGAAALDLDPTSATATLVSPTADKDGDGVPDVVKALKSLRVLGGTNFAPAVRTACQLLATTGSPNLVGAFLSDGQQSSSLTKLLPCSPPVTFQAFAVGAGSRCASGAPVGARLLDVATLSGGTCTDVPTVTDLPDILPQVVATRITQVTYTVDGGDPVDLSPDLGLPKDGPDSVDVAFDLPSSLASGTHRVCLTVTGSDAGGTGSQTTCSDLVSVTGEVAYSWKLVSSQGPPIFLSSRTSAHPTFVAADDGHYTLRLTVSDGTGAVAVDDVDVTVTNVDPHLELSHGDSFAGGVTQVNATLTDEGWLDTHRATVDWGDGTTDAVDVTTSGPGWGTFFGSHVYRRPGSYAVSVVLTDDDGGTATAGVDHLEVSEPVAVWANSTASRSFDWGGGSGEIQGRVHTNGELRFVGASKTVTGGTTYAGSIAADTTKNSFLPLPAKAAVQDFPFRPQVADFRPGGPVATEVGAAYHDMSSSCSAGSWHDVQAALPSGVYYASCDIQLNGSQIGGRVTLVSEGHIKISGSRPAFEPYRDGLLLLAGASGTKAVDIATSSSKFLGVVFAGAGQISVSGGTNRFYCGLLGDTVSITGTDVSVRGASCGRPDATVSGPVVVPDLGATMTVDHDTALPSDQLGYDVTVTNRGTTVVVPSLIGLENVDTTAATVSGYTFAVERQDATTHQWVPVASVGDPSMRVNVHANPYDGVTYPTGGAVAGTTVAPGGWATWGLQAVLSLTPDQAAELLDPVRTSGVRSRVDFDLSPSGVQARRLYTYGTDFAARLRALGADATDIGVTTVLPDGASDVTQVPEGAPSRLAPGESTTLHRGYVVPVPAPRRATESDAGYLSRLLALDGSELDGASFAVARGGVGRLVVPLQRVGTTRRLPVVGISTTGAGTVPAGSSEDYELRLANLGSVDASALEVKASADGTPLPVTGAPTSLAAGELVAAHTTYAAPAGSSGTLALRGTAGWQDARGNTYGVTGSDLAVLRQVPAALSASLADALLTDVQGDGAVSPGDTVRYTLVVRNSGGAPLTGVSGTVPAGTGSALVSASGRTPDGGTVSITDGQVTFSLPDIAGGASRSVTFDVQVADPFPTGVSGIQTQGTVAATGLAPVQTDDPALPGAADPTRTTVTVPHPALTASMSGQLVVDADGSGVVSAGDTLKYTVAVTSVGTQQVTGIHTLVHPPAGTTLVDGSVSTSQGTAASTGDVDVAIGTLAPFQQATVTFRLRLDKPLPTGMTSVVTSGTVTSDQLEPLSTDDPQTVDAGDPSTIPIGDPAGDPERPGPTTSAVTPADGTRVTDLTTVSATLTAPGSATVTTWKIVLEPAAGGPETVVATGTSGQPTADISAVIDPSLLDNGAYVLKIVSASSDGGTSSVSSSVLIDGQFKPGRMTTSFLDHEVALGGLPLQVIRSYDSFDRTNGDFGTGWQVGIADFRVSTTAPLGQSGWRAQSQTCGLIFCTLKYTSTTPHFVSVVWPDGHQEAFDLVGINASTFFPGLAQASFEPRPGTDTTSKLEVVGDSSLFFIGDSAYGGAFGSGGLFDPQTFKLTDRQGTSYVIDRSEGLQTMTDRTGNSLTFTRDGVTSSSGPSITFTRDANDRITRIASPAGTTGYAYDHGDLVRSTDLLGVDTTYEYVDHRLTNVRGAGGRSLGSAEYDADGRMTAWTDADGNRTVVEAATGSRQEKVTDPGGRRTTISTYDENGRLARINEVYGGANHVTELAYDATGNVISRKDPLGRVWSATYSQGRLTSMTTPGGRTTRVTYDSLGLPQTWTDPTGAVTTYSWNPVGTLASVTDAAGKTETYTYDGQGNRLSKTDRLGNLWQWTYTPSGLLESARDPLGGVTRYEYDAAGHAKAVVDPNGRRTTATYNAFGDKTSQTDADGRTTAWTYDDRGHVLTETDPAGHTVDYTYDPAGRLSSVDNHVDAPTSYTFDPMGRLLTTRIGALPPETLAYDDAGHVTSSEDELGRTTRWTYLADGRVDTETNPAGGVTSYTYTADGQVQTEVDPTGGTTRYSYDALGRTASVTDPTGARTEQRYDERGRPTVTVNPDGTRTEMRYDDAGHLVAAVDEAGDTTGYEYDAAGRQVAVVDAAGRRSTLSYDAAGRLTATTDPLGAVTRLTYTAAGLPDTRTTPQGSTTTFGYDAAGRRTSVTDGLGHVWSTGYDALGRVRTQRDPRQQSGPATLTNAYDANGRLVSTTDAAGHTVGFGYDAAGERTSVTDARGKTWTTDFGPLGRPTRTTDPLGRATTAVFDTAGRLTSRTDARGTTVDLGYDPVGRVTSLSESGGTGRVGFSYDARGRRATMTDSTGTSTWSYTPDGDLASLATPEGTIGYTYDASGLRSTMTQAQGTVHYSYDPAGRLSSILDWRGGTTSVAYDLDGRLESVTRPNGVQSTWSYDAASRLTGVRHLKGGTLLDQATYTLDADGNRTSLRTSAGLESYGYDAADQLTSATSPSGATTSYTYDAAGNRLTRQSGSAAPVSYTYDAAGQLTSVGGTPVGHDAAGNTTSAGGSSYDWDWLSRLTRVTDASGGVTRYAYDGDGVRVSETAGGTTDALVYDRSTASGVPQLVQDGSAGFLYGPSGVIEETTAGGAGYPLTDAQGTVRALTDGSGAVTATATYDPFGAVTGGSGAIGGLGFTGAPQAGDLVHLAARDLQPSTGRFLSVDPARPGAPGVVGWNQYSYVANNPATWTDPSGRTAAVEYGLNLRAIVTAGLITSLAMLAWEVLKFYVAPTTFVGLGSLPSAPSIDNDATTKPKDTTKPLPIPLPNTDVDWYRRRDCSYSGGGSWYAYGPLDHLNRATGAAACLKRPLSSDSGAPQTPEGYEPGLGLHRGHLIARVLGGDSSNPANFVPLYAHANTPLMRDFELKARDLVEGGETLLYMSVPKYSGDNLLPDGVSLAYVGTRGSAAAVTILNIP